MVPAYIIGGGCSDDGFWDFRSWLAVRGKRVYLVALRNPESLARVVSPMDNDRRWKNFLKSGPVRLGGVDRPGHD